MATLAPHQSAETAPSHWQEGNPSEDALAHIPGEGGGPIVGNTFNQVWDDRQAGASSPCGAARQLCSAPGETLATPQPAHTRRLRIPQHAFG